MPDRMLREGVFALLATLPDDALIWIASFTEDDAKTTPGVLAAAGAKAVIQRGTLAARPAAGIDGRLYVVTDSGAERLTRDSGSSWVDLTHGSAGHTGNVFPGGANQNVGDAYVDLGDIAAPANPGVGVRRLYLDSSTGKLSVRTSGGTSVSLEEQGGGAPVGAAYVVGVGDGTLTSELVLGSAVIMLGTLASRPAASLNGRLYYVTDSGSERLTRDNGAAWVDLSIAASTIASGTIATARLGSGTASSATVLCGDQTYQPRPTAGTYTPTPTNVANVASFTPVGCQWTQTPIPGGTTSVVAVSGAMIADTTAGTTLTQFRMTLPVAANFASTNQCGGVGAFIVGTTQVVVSIYGDATNDQALFEYVSEAAAGSNVIRFNLQYLVP